MDEWFVYLSVMKHGNGKLEFPVDGALDKSCPNVHPCVIHVSSMCHPCATHVPVAHHAWEGHRCGNCLYLSIGERQHAKHTIL
jgi:hypothetical protein